MSSLRYFRSTGLLVLCAIALFGCTAKGPIDQFGNALRENQLGGYAVAEVEIKKGPRAQSFSMVDGVMVQKFCEWCFLQEINLKPGPHSIVKNIGFDASHQLIQETFNFSVEAGNRYTLAEGRIVVTTRNDPSHLVYDLVRIAGRDPSAYYPPSAIAQYNENARMQQAEAEQQRIRNRPLVRKIGAHICKQQGAFVYAGYVEHVTDDRVQIRVASASAKENLYVSAAGFQPSIIWDSPLNWDLCE